MRTTANWILVLAAFVFLSFSQASAQLFITITMATDPSGVTLGGTGTSNTTLAFGNVQSFGGSLPSGATRTVGSSSWVLGSLFDLKVTCNILNLLQICLPLDSSSFTLLAEEQSSDAVDTLTVSGFVLNLSLVTIAALAAYNVFTPYTFAMTIPFTKASGFISNVVIFVAVAN
jgi:hypothetical protein